MMKSTHTGKKKTSGCCTSLSLSASRWPWNQQIQDNWIRIPISKEDGTKPVDSTASSNRTDQSLLRTELQTSQWVLILIKQLITISHVQPEGGKLQEKPLSFRSNPIFSIKFDLSIKSNLFDQIRSFRSNLEIFLLMKYFLLGFFTWCISWVPTLLSSSSSSTSCSWYLVSQMYNKHNSLPSAHWSGNQSSCSILCVGAGSAGYHVYIPVFRTLHVIVLIEWLNFAFHIRWACIARNQTAWA